MVNNHEGTRDQQRTESKNQDKKARNDSQESVRRPAPEIANSNSRYQSVELSLEPPPRQLVQTNLAGSHWTRKHCLVFLFRFPAQ